MKKKLFMLLSFLCVLLFSVSAFAKTNTSVTYDYVNKVLTYNSASPVDISGIVPKLDTNNSSLKNSVNNNIIDSCNKKLSQILIEPNVNKIIFSYDNRNFNYNSNNYISIIVNINVWTYTSTKTEKLTFNINNDEGVSANLLDVLGPNGKTLAFNRIKNTITNDPDNYADVLKEISKTSSGVASGTLKELSNNESFYIKNNKGNSIIIIYFGREFEFDFSRITNYTFQYSYAKGNTTNKLVSLREVGNAFGYRTTWNNRSKSINFRKGNEVFTINVGSKQFSSNLYGSKTLTIPPTLINNSTYITPEFFEQIAGVVYSTNNDEITFSSYN